MGFRFVPADALFMDRERITVRTRLLPVVSLANVALLCLTEDRVATLLGCSDGGEAAFEEGAAALSGPALCLGARGGGEGAGCRDPAGALAFRLADGPEAAAVGAMVAGIAAVDAATISTFCAEGARVCDCAGVAATVTGAEP
jgi:hypothetical protein